MQPKKIIGGLILTAALIITPYITQAANLADGHDWTTSSENERLAYMVGLANTISVGNQYDVKKLPGVEKTFMRVAFGGLSRTTITEATQHIDDWYKAHPDELDKPVISVIWIKYVKPHQNAEK